MGHGLSGTMDNMVAYAERFTAAGVGIFMLDYRHFGESDGEPRRRWQ